MGTSRTVGEFVGKLARIPGSFQEAQRQAAPKVGMVGKRILLDQAQQDNGSLKFRNAGKNGSKLGAGYDVRDAGGKKLIEVKPRGWVWAILQGGAKPHVITSKYAGGSRKSRQQRVEGGQRLQRGGGRGGRAVLRTPAGYRRWVKHPGVKPKRTFTKARDRFFKEAPSIAKKEYDEALRRVFR